MKELKELLPSSSSMKEDMEREVIKKKDNKIEVKPPLLLSKEEENEVTKKPVLDNKDNKIKVRVGVL